MRTLRGQHRADVARRARRGAVALHGDDGVADREAGTDEIGKIDEHRGKIVRIRVAEVIFRFQGAGDDAEEVLDGAGHAHHAVRL